MGEIFHVLQHRPINRVIVPASLPGLEASGLRKLRQGAQCPSSSRAAPGRIVIDRLVGGHSGEWHTASTLLPSGSRTKAP